MVPGALRQRDVQVGQHVAPAHASVLAFLTRWSAFYGGVRRGEAALVALACAHQRLGWVHPFVDGNGRVMRLHTHTWLTAQSYTGGLWSPLRGFARSTERYYALLADAESLRRGATDFGLCFRSCGPRQRRTRRTVECPVGSESSSVICPALASAVAQLVASTQR